MKSIKIGILTLPLHTNYGGILQAYALQTILERMGNDVVVFNRKLLPKLPCWRIVLSIGKRMILRYIMGRQNVNVTQPAWAYKVAIKMQLNLRKFIDTYIHEMQVDKLGEIPVNKYDAIVVGSDQIWRDIYMCAWSRKNMADCFLAFTQGYDIKRVAYAASFGTDCFNIPQAQLNKCRESAAMFDAVSVREESGIGICKNVLGVNADWMPDPTLLLDRNDYLKIISSLQPITDNPYLLSYMLDMTPEKASLCERVASSKGLEVRNAQPTSRATKLDEVVPLPPMESWLWNFANADYVINDSFHGCVFSILFHKQFVAIANKSRGIARFTSLLKMFGLEDRLIYSPADYHPIPDIDYTGVDAILHAKRKEAMDFLSQALEQKLD